MRRIAALVAAGLLFLGLATSSSSTTPGVSAHGAWERIPAAPLSPRYDAVGVALDDALLVVGGTYEPPCPPNASCVPWPKPPFRDGAIFDFESGQWRRIAPAPTPLTWAHTAVVGNYIYFLQPASAADTPGAKYVRYDVTRDRWETIPRPPAPRPQYERVLREWDGQVVALTSKQAFAYDPDLRIWTDIPNSPALHSAVPEEVARRIDPDTWHPIDEAQTGGCWVWAGRRLVNPLNSKAEDFNDETGGIIDVTTGQRVPLPAGYPLSRPYPRSNHPETVLGYGDYAVGYGKVLDVSHGTWSRVPELPSHVDGGAVQTLVGDRVVVWGGFDGYRPSSEFLLTGYYWRITV